MYLTAAQLADRPGSLEIAQVATPESSPVVDADLMDATLRGEDRSAWLPADTAIADQALARVNESIDSAGDLIDGYIGKRYSLPLDPVPGVLTVWARAIARYMLHKDRRSMESDDPIVRDYRDAQKLLQLVAQGKFSLGADDPSGADSATGDVKFTGDGTVFGRDQTHYF